MDILKKYAIPYKGLSTGRHHFSFKVDHCFFEAFEGSEVQRGEAIVTVEMEKQANMLVLDFRIEGAVEVTCDRCLEEFDMPVSYEGRLVVRFSETEQESDGEVMWISPAEPELTLGQYIYESIMLSLPYQRVHGTDENGNLLCNPEMLSRFRIVSEEEFEALAHRHKNGGEKEEESSPWNRLEALKKELEEEEQ